MRGSVAQNFMQYIISLCPSKMSLTMTQNNLAKEVEHAAFV